MSPCLGDSIMKHEYIHVRKSDFYWTLFTGLEYMEEELIIHPHSYDEIK